MKILSNFKDYYDFAAGYDTDPRKVYERKMEEVDRFNTQYKDIEYKIMEDIRYDIHIFFGIVWFCDIRYPYLQNLIDKKIYYDYNEIPIELKEKIEIYNKNLIKEYKWYSSRKYRIELEEHFNIKPKKEDWTHFRKKYPEKQNTKLNTPIIFSYLKDGIYEEIIKNGKLIDVGFNKVKSPQEAFTEIYNFIPYYEPDMPSDPTDMQRFENKGFDKKTSFRNI